MPQDQLDAWSNEQILQAIARDPQPEKNYYINDLRAELMRDQLGRQVGVDDARSIYLKRQLAAEVLRAGLSMQALEEIGRIQGMLAAIEAGAAKEISDSLDWLLATAYLRIGKQYNCLHNHRAQSCILPITEQGIHLATEGSELAIKQLSQILQGEPGNLAARWLLNLA